MVMCVDALAREESCGGHFREEHQTEEGEALRDDIKFSHVAAWEWTGDPTRPSLSKEELEFEYVALTARSYK
jgi:succinate dehydrogenase / fumarate reductase flavoprotein subunit